MEYLNLEEKQNGPCHLLILDDEEDVRVLLKEILLGLGYRVSECPSARQATETIQFNDIDIVLTDIRMPGMSGIEFTTWIKTHHPQIDVIIMTGFASIETAAEAVHLGANDYLVKPFPEIGMVGATVRRIAEKRELTSKLHRIHEELQKSKDSFENIVERNMDGILVVSHGKIFYANLVIERFLGKKRQDLIGQSFEIPLGQESITEINFPLETGKKGTAEVRFDTTKWQSDPAHLAIFRDITERKRLQAQVAQSDRLASIGMLAAGVAHEVNNPLTYILFNLEKLTETLPQIFTILNRSLGLLTTKLGHETISGLDGIDWEIIKPETLSSLINSCNDALAGAQHIRDIARGLKTFSRSDEDKREPISVINSIESAIAMAYNEIKYRARLIKDYNEVPLVLANEGRLCQVFLNLLVNAAHAIEEGNVQHNKIRIYAYATENEVIIEIQDSGKGIPNENLNHIFEPFFTTKDSVSGSGLGLSICYNIITSYGGKIEVKSDTIKKQTTFSVRLPINKSTQPEMITSALSTTETNVVSPVRGRILIIEDDQPILLSLQSMLSTAHEVIALNSCVEAEELLTQDASFDVILCDILMPEVTGMDLYKWIKNNNPGLEQRIVFMTGGVFTEQANEFLNQIPNTIIEKPFNLQKLKMMIYNRVALVENKSVSINSNRAPSDNQQDINDAVDISLLVTLNEALGKDAGNTLPKVIEKYLQKVHTSLDIIQNAISQNNGQTFAEIAHQLKSSSKILGAHRLAAMYQELESLGRSSRITDAMEKVSCIENELKYVTPVLDFYMHNPMNLQKTTHKS